MRVYLDLVLLLNFAVDLLLIMGTNRLAGYPVGLARAAIASGFGAVYAVSCLINGFVFLSGSVWRIVSLAVMSVIAFGYNRSAVRRGVLFILLSMALGGIAVGIGTGGVVSLILSAGGLALLCMLGFRGRMGAEYDRVQLRHNGKEVRLTALRDTGNTLTDPVTGENVLIVGADVAFELLELTRSQLSDPIGTMCDRRTAGLRLIPYRAVGNPNGMLLALRVEDVTINGRTASRIVAFAPENFDRAGEYQALTGGVL